MLANNFKNSEYRSPTSLGTAVILVLGGLAATGVLSVIVSAIMLLWPGISIPAEGGRSFDLGMVFVGLLALAQLGLRLLCVILFLVWLHRAFKNLPVIGAKYLEFTPGWAVGWWFVPFANLFKPYQIIKELYASSDLAANPDSEGTTENVGLWWGTFLCANIVLRIADGLIGDLDNASKGFAAIFLVGELLFVGAALLCMLIVKRVNTWQTQAISLVAASEVFAPPPPPAFDTDPNEYRTL